MCHDRPSWSPACLVSVRVLQMAKKAMAIRQLSVAGVALPPSRTGGRWRRLANTAWVLVLPSAPRGHALDLVEDRVHLAVD